MLTAADLLAFRHICVTHIDCLNHPSHTCPVGTRPQPGINARSQLSPRSPVEKCAGGRTALVLPLFL